MKKRRFLIRTILATVLTTIVLQVLVSLVGVGLFYHFFYARYDDYCPTDLKETDLTAVHTPVTFASGGNTLSGLFIGNGQKGLIVIVHGLNSGMDAHFAEADYFAAQGYTVFTFDGRGTRSSGGASRDSVSSMRDDLDAALDYLATTSYASYTLYLYGHSSGGYAVATTAARATATAALCAFDSPLDVMCETADRVTGFLSRLQRPFLALWNRWKAGADANERASAVLNRTDANILIISADRDGVIPPGCALAASEITDPNATYATYPGGHSDLWLSEAALAYRSETGRDSETVDRLRYTAVDTDFLDDVLAFFDAA